MTETLITRLERAADHGTNVHVIGSGATEDVSWKQIHDDARRMAAAMQARGVAPGDRVALLGATSRLVLTAVQATWLAGGALVMLPGRTRLGSPEEFRAQTSRRIAVAEAALVVTDPDERDAIEPIEPARATTFDDLWAEAASPAGKGYERPVEDPEAIAILQFTSGSTADPKGVVIPHRCVMANNDAQVARSPLEPGEDVVVSWAPLYHDMGLVFLLTPTMTRGVELVVAPPGRFVASPGSWMQWMSDYGGTWTIGPNFAVAIAARMLAASSATLDLSRCRGLGNGAEPVDPKTMVGFGSAGVPHGFDPRSLFAAYGMAEATVLISLKEKFSGFTEDVVDGETLEQDLRAVGVDPSHPNAKRLARCGYPIDGLEVRIADPQTGSVVPERVVGEIEARGTSVVPGYFRDPEATAAAFREGGWLRTGDLGYLADGDVVVCGRLKDIIIIGGRNLFPDDLERVANDVEGVRKGNVIAFGVDHAGMDRESVVIVAETKEREGLAQIRDGIARAVGDVAGVRPGAIVLLPPGTLPKTSSGKVRRGICRARFLTNELEAL